MTAPRKLPKLKPIPATRFCDMIRVLAWREIFRPDLTPGAIRYHCRARHLKMPSGDIGALKASTGWMIHPLAKIVQDKHPAGPGRPKGSVDKVKRKSRKLGYPRPSGSMDSLINKSR